MTLPLRTRHPAHRPRLAAALAAICVAAAACGGGGGGSGGDAEPTFGLEARVPVSGLNLPTGAPPPVTGFRAVAAFPALNRDLTRGPLLSSPVFLTAAGDQSDRVFVVEQAGRILVFENRDDVLRSEVEVFLDIRGQVASGGEMGLLGLAFSPDYATSRELYVHYTLFVGSQRTSRISRFRASVQDPDHVDPQTEEVVLDVAQPFGNHNGGMVAFGPDGLLYISLGDGGSGGDPQNHGQNRGTLLGSMLRIDPVGQTTYAVPPSNPFVGDPAARPEVYAYGLRHPWRFSFDRQSGALWLGDVGQGAREEVDLIAAGDNLGWRRFEGDRLFDGSTSLAGPARAPVLDYGRSTGNAVIGGYVYRGTQHPSMQGLYFYGDHGSGAIFALLHDGQGVVSNDRVLTQPGLASFGEDEAGEVYLVDHDGDLFRVEPEQGPPPPSQGMPQLLSDTGVFQDPVTALEPAPGIIEYEVNAPLWSDAAVKRRWIALPGFDRIGFAAEGPWSFPVGTVLVKHFELELVVGDPASRRKLETRLLLHTPSGWQGHTYRWNDAQTDAELLTGGLDEDFQVTDPDAPGGVRTQTWTYPSSAQCATCHTDAAGHILGVRARQLNRDFAYPARTDNQLRAWGHIGLFGTAPGDPAALPAHPDPADPAAGDLEERARAYLDANCAQCHLPQGGTGVDMDLRAHRPLVDAGLVDAPPTHGDLGLTDPRRVAAGDPDRSVLLVRMEGTGAERMPPLASHLVDDEAATLIRAWIASLGGGSP